MRKHKLALAGVTLLAASLAMSACGSRAEQAPGGQAPEADPADAELAIDRAGAATELATVAVAVREPRLRGVRRLDHLGLGRHVGLTVTWFPSGADSVLFRPTIRMLSSA